MSSTKTQRTLTELRETAGLTQAEVARRMGVIRPRVYQIERDFPSVRFDVVQEYLRALGGEMCIFGIGEDDIMTKDIAHKGSGADSHPRTGDQ